MAGYGSSGGHKANHLDTRTIAIATAVEVALVFAAILAYIWYWERSHPLAWISVLAFILLTHVLHHDTFRKLGLGPAGLQACAAWLLPIALVLYLPLLAFGILSHVFMLLRPTWHALVVLLGYGIWCAFQQYLAQSYFHARLELVVPEVHFRCAIVGFIFSAAHLPNPILMVATFIAGFVFAEAFARYRNIWPLAFAQAVGGLLLAAVIPDTLIHHMRVGPGYFFYGIR